ncbi:MAG: hypothetical protein SF123_02060 [Chloroflexota bacterium]|nr:hypothetical protein [Chloroflexota bacterium]
MNGMAFFWQLWQRLLRVHPQVTLVVDAPPDIAMNTLLMAARPSQSRLHHRDLFASGRRYYLRQQRDGFQLVSDSKTPWHSRRRTARTAIVDGSLSAAGSLTTVRLHARLRLRYLLIGLLMPLWMSALVVTAPWSPEITVVIVISLFFLSIASIRLSAALQAHEMIFFARKALEDLPAGEIVPLAAATDVVIDARQRDFNTEWARFYEDRAGEQTQA